MSTTIYPSKPQHKNTFSAQATSEYAFKCRAVFLFLMSAVFGSITATGTVKKGNDGSVSCNTYCRGLQWGPKYNTCVSAWDTRYLKPLKCDAVRGVPSYFGNIEVTCYCDGLVGKGPTVRKETGR